MIARSSQAIQDGKDTHRHPAIRPGANALMGSNPLGFWIGGSGGGGADFSHPFLVTVSGGKARMSQGFILTDKASVEPLIGQVPVSGTDKQPQPALNLSFDDANADGESWICVEVTPDKDGSLDAAGKKSKVVAVHRNAPMVSLGLTGRVPLALLAWSGGKIKQVNQIAMFHLRYVTSIPAGGAPDDRKHLFL